MLQVGVGNLAWLKTAEKHLVLLKTTLYKEVQTPLVETLFSEH